MMHDTCSTDFIIPLHGMGMSGVETNGPRGRDYPGCAGDGVSELDGFATTRTAFRAFLNENGLEGRIRDLLGLLESDLRHARVVGAEIRAAIACSAMPNDLAQAICEAYCGMHDRSDHMEPPVAVWSYATSDDMPAESFTGDENRFHYVKGCEPVLEKVKACFTSLYSDSVIAYRVRRGLDDRCLALSVGVHRVVGFDTVGTGDAFTAETEIVRPGISPMVGGHAYF